MKLSQLKEGIFYECKLSGNKILIVSKAIFKYRLPYSTKDIESDVVHGYYYEKSIGSYNQVVIFDNQLKELPPKHN